jgi:segregation and condensation protein B
MAAETRRALEAILMVADTPVEVSLLAQLLEVSPARVEELCAELEAAYRDEDRGFALVRVAGGYRYQSHADLAPYVERFVLEGQTARLSAAALETLAIVAYKQPVSRAQIASIRGVNADGVLRTLQARGFVAEVGRDPGPGQAVLYGTTPLLLERLGLDRLDELPPLAQFVPGSEIMDALEQSLRADLKPPAPATDEESADTGRLP